MKFDISAARSSGYSDDEIASYLAQEKKFDLAAALESGYTPAEVVGFLSEAAPTGGRQELPADVVPSQGRSATPMGQADPRIVQPAGPGVIQRVADYLKPAPKSVLEDYVPTPEEVRAQADRRLSYGAGPISSETAAKADLVRSSMAKPDSKVVQRTVQGMDRVKAETLADLVSRAKDPETVRATRDAKAAEFRSAGEWAVDTVSNLSQGAVGLVQLPINIIAPSSDVAEILRGTQKELQAAESDVLRASREQLKERVLNEDGFLDKYVATVKQLVTDPTIAASEFARQLPNFVGVVAAARATGAAAAGTVGLAGRASPTLALGEAISGGAIQAAARGAGVTAGGAGASMIMAGGDAAGSVYETLTSKDPKVLEAWQKNPDYLQLRDKKIASGASPEDAAEQAVEELATTKARMAALITAPLGLLGYAGAESAIASKGLGRATAEALTARGMAKTAAKDLGGEQLEEGGTQFGGNVITRTVNPDQSLTQGVPEAMATALVTSAPFTAAGLRSQYKEASAEPAGLINSTINFTPADSPTAQAGLAPIVVPVPAGAPDVSTGLGAVPAVAAGDQLPGDLSGAGLGAAGLDRPLAGRGADGGATGMGAVAGAPGVVPDGAGQRPAGLSRPLERATDSDLLARAEQSLAARENNNADTAQPAEQWMGRRGDGYLTQVDAQQALPGRQRMFKDLDWKVEQMPSGKFRLAGYEQNVQVPAEASAVTPAAGRLPAAGIAAGTMETNGLNAQQQETVRGTQTTQAFQGQTQGQANNTNAGAVAAGAPLSQQRNADLAQGAGAQARPPLSESGAQLRLAPSAPVKAFSSVRAALNRDANVDIAMVPTAAWGDGHKLGAVVARMLGKTYTVYQYDSGDRAAVPNGFVEGLGGKHIMVDAGTEDAPVFVAFHEGFHALPDRIRKKAEAALLGQFRAENLTGFRKTFSLENESAEVLAAEIPAYMAQAIARRPDFINELREKLGNRDFAEFAKVLLAKLNEILGKTRDVYGDDFVKTYIKDVDAARNILTNAYAQAMREQGMQPDAAVVGDAQPVASQRANGREADADVMPPKQIRADGIMFSLKAVEQINDATPITMQDLVGETVFPILADLTAAGYVYMGKELRGGPYYTLLPSNTKAGLVWANDAKGVSSIKEKKAKRGVIGLIVAMKQTSHATNNTVANIIFRAVEDEIQKGAVAGENVPRLDEIVRGLADRKAKNKKTGKMESIFPQFADFPGFSDRSASEKFLREMPFEARGLFFEEMSKPTVEDLGLGVVRKVINDTVEPDLRGLNMGDVIMAVRFDPDAEAIELGEKTGTPEHDSYRYGIKGEVIGKFTKPISFQKVFVDLMAERRAAGKDSLAGNYRSLTLRKPEQLITQEIADAVSPDPYQTFTSPAEAQAAVKAAAGEWVAIDRPTAAGVKEFLRTAKIYGEKEVPSFVETKQLIKDGLLSIHRLGETENWFAIEDRDGKMVATNIMVAQPGVRRETLFSDIVSEAKANGATHLEINGSEAPIQDQPVRPVDPIISELSAMKDADLINLGIDPKEIDRLNGLIEDGADQVSPTSVMMFSKKASPADRIKWTKISDLKTEIGLDSLPRHIIPFATFMRTMADKAGNGGLTSRDLIKAYTIARSSMNRTAVSTQRVKDAGLVLPENFSEAKIRPEGAFGYWLLSPVGQRYLNAAEVAIVDEQAVADAVKVMAPFGTQNALGKDLERAAGGDLHTRLPGMAAAIAKAASGKNAVKDWQDATDNLFGVREAKKGFLGSLLGFGQLPTFDARQINVNVKAESKEDTLRALSSVKARDVVAKLSRRMDALGLTMAPEYAPFYQHLVHHAVWDAVGGTETTHSDVVESMLMASRRAAPQREGVVFEVAPDPADDRLTNAWRSLDQETRLQISESVARQVVPDVLARMGTEGSISPQIGSYLDDTNPSFVVLLEGGDALSAAKLLGFVLAQDSMVVMSPRQFAGSQSTGALAIEIGEKTPAEVDAIYQALREIEIEGVQPIAGQSTVDGVMTVLNYSSVSTDALANLVDQKLNKAYTVLTRDVFTAFPEKQEYDYGSEKDDGRGSSADLRRGARALRAEATAALEQSIRAAGVRFSNRAGDGGREGGRGAADRQVQAPERADAQEALSPSEPLPGAPRVQGFTGPDPRLVAVAEQYARDTGITLRRQAEYVQVDPERAARIAQAYEAMPHAPQDLRVKAAYKELIKQTLAQYRALEKAGYKFWFINFDKPDNAEYASSPWNAMRDIRANKQMGVFPTDDGFGSGDFDPASNPLLEDTGIKWPSGGLYGPRKRVLANDLFRAVHDAFGHGLEGAGFRAQGEENAWQAHRRLFTGAAVAAITSETRGQNSWLNYGPNGESNRNAKVEDTVFADQKTGLMPEWTWTEGVVGDMPDAPAMRSRQSATIEVDGVDRPATNSNGQPIATSEEALRNFWRWFGDSKVVDAEGRPLVVYHSSLDDKVQFDKAGRFMGFTGVSGISVTDRAEMASRYLDRFGAFRYDGKAFEKNVMALYVKAENPLERDEPFKTNLPLGAPLPEGYVSEVEKMGYDALIRNDAISRKGPVKHSDAKNAIRGREIVVFKPENVKSATGNDGSFDPENPDIRFSNRAGKRQKLSGLRFEIPALTSTDAGRRVIQDDALRMKRVIEAVKNQNGVVGEAQNFYEANTLMPGRIQAAMDDFRDNVMTPLIDKAVAADIDLDELALYAYAKHARERNAYIATINPRLPDGGSGMKNADAAQILADVAAGPKAAEFDALHKDLMAITATTRQLMLNEGLITQDEFDAMDSAYNNYIPLRGLENVDEDTGAARPGVGRGINVRGKETIRALGRRSRASDLIENAIRDYQRVITRVEKNDVGKVLLDFVLSNPDADLWGADIERNTASFDKKRGLVQYTKVVEKGEDTIGVKVGGKQIYIKLADQDLTRALRQAWKEETSGLERVTLAATGWWNNWMRAVLTRYNPAFAVINIPRDALWSGTTAALADLGPKGLARYTAAYGKALMASGRKEAGVAGTTSMFGNPTMDRMFEEFRSAGGITGGFYMRGLDEITDDLRNDMLQAGAKAKNPWEAVKAAPPYKLARGTLKALEFIGSASENATRFALYIAAREGGKTPQQAALLAKNGTTNFNRKGEWGGALNNLYLFFNAAVQGTAQLFYVLKSPAVKAAMAGVAGVGAMLALYGAAAGGEDDDGEAYWDKVPSYVKERNLVIMLPPGGPLMDGMERVGKRGRYITVPVQYGFNIFPNAGYMVADVFRNQQDPRRGLTATKAALHMTSVTLGSINPFGGAVDLSDGVQVLLAAMPTLVDLPVQLINERGTFGTPSAPERSSWDMRPDSERMFTSQMGTVPEKIAKALNELGGGNEAKPGEILGIETSVTPGTIQTLISATGGGLGTFMEQVATSVMAMSGSDKDLKAAKTPFLNKFYGEVDEGVNIRGAGDRMREVRKEVAELESQFKIGLSPKIGTDEQRMLALADAGKQYQDATSKMRKDEIAIIKSDMPEPQKKLLRQQIQVERDKLATVVNRVYLDSLKQK